MGNSTYTYIGASRLALSWRESPTRIWCGREFDVAYRCSSEWFEGHLSHCILIPNYIQINFLSKSRGFSHRCPFYGVKAEECLISYIIYLEGEFGVAETSWPERQAREKEWFGFRVIPGSSKSQQGWTWNTNDRKQTRDETTWNSQAHQWPGQAGDFS